MDSNSKKRFLLAAISIALASTFPGCSSDSGGGEPAPSVLSAITSVSIHVTAPATGETPSGAATAGTGEAGYSVGAVQWSPSGSKFLGSTAYTATVTLTASEGYTFTGLSSAKIDGHDAATPSNTGGSVTLSYAFAATSAKIVTDISIKTQPSKLAYAHWEELDLSGLAVTLAYNDGTSEDVASSDFEGKNIETEPEEGITLLHPSHDGVKVKVEYGDHLSAETNSLSVLFPLCGEERYNPDTQFCYNSSKVGDKCGARTETFDPDLYECRTGDKIYLKTKLTDSRDSKEYEAVLIGTQTWMAENLNYAADGSRCYGDNTGGDSQNRCDTYGRLYNWATAMDIAATYNSTSYTVTTPHQGVCPDGWHLPSDAEWTALTTAIGGESGGGAKLKAMSGWSGSPGNGTDDYGFSALPGGYGNSIGFGNVGSYGYWWSSTQIDASNARRRSMGYSYEYVNTLNLGKTNVHSVRCLQD